MYSHYAFYQNPLYITELDKLCYYKVWGGVWAASTLGDRNSMQSNTQDWSFSTYNNFFSSGLGVSAIFYPPGPSYPGLGKVIVATVAKLYQPKPGQHSHYGQVAPAKARSTKLLDSLTRQLKLQLVSLWPTLNIFMHPYSTPSIVHLLLLLTSFAQHWSYWPGDYDGAFNYQVFRLN